MMKNANPSKWSNLPIRAKWDPISSWELSPQWQRISDATPSAENILSFVCSPEVKADVASCVSCYEEIKREAVKLEAVPDEKTILVKLIWPLRNAKANYVLGNYLGTIALCGLVAEMLAVLLFEVRKESLAEFPLDIESQRRMFGTTFEKLPQSRRIDVLRVYQAIDDDMNAKLNTIRSLRNQHIHSLFHQTESIARDAVETFHCCIQLMRRILIAKVEGRTVYINSDLAQYLEDNHVILHEESLTRGENTTEENEESA